jgi:FlaG/FlaF family flagellin (archaellin)
MKTFVSKFAVAAIVATFVSVPALIVTSTSSVYASGCGCSHKLPKASAQGNAEAMSTGGGSIYALEAGGMGGSDSSSKSKSTGGKSTSASGDSTYSAHGTMNLEFKYGNVKKAEITGDASGSTNTTANTGN